MEKGPTTMQLGRFIKEIGSMEGSKAMGYANGPTPRNTKDSGMITKSMGMESILGLMGASTKETTEATRSMDKVHTPGQMDGSI